MASSKIGAVAALAVAATLAGTAFAAPARQGTVTAAAPYAWDGGPGNGVGHGTTAVRCTPGVYECEDTLVELKDAGDLLADIRAGSGSNDLDVAIYKSDSSGAVASDPVNGDSPSAEDTSTGKDAKATLRKATPGFYVVRVRFFDAVQGAYKGTASVKTAAAAPTPVPAASATPTPTATPAKPKPSAAQKRAACKKTAKKIKNKRKRAKALKRCKKIH